MVFSQNSDSVPTPDYANRTTLLLWNANTMSSPAGVLGAYAYAGIQDSKTQENIISDGQWFTVPKDGYIVAIANGYPTIDKTPGETTCFVSLASPGKTDWRFAFCFYYIKNSNSIGSTVYIPVEKGNRIVAGTQYSIHALPSWVGIYYYPVKLKDASSI